MNNEAGDIEPRSNLIFLSRMKINKRDTILCVAEIIVSVKFFANVSIFFYYYFDICDTFPTGSLIYYY